MKKIIIIILAVIIVIVLAIINPLKNANSIQNNSVHTSTAVVNRGNLIIAINSTGIVEPILTVELKSKASGEIIELAIEEGDLVNKGQLIARLDAAAAVNDYNQAEADYEVAKASLSQAKKQRDRQEKLYLQGLISEIDFESAELAQEQANSNLVRAKTALEYARERLSDTVIESPINGIILKKFVEKGQIIASGISTVSGGTAIATVADMSKVYIRTSVDEIDIGQIAAGQKASINAESYPDHEFYGEVLRIHPQAKIEQNVTTFDVTIEVDNAEGLLMAGMNASVEIIASYKENVLLIPREALTDVRTIAKMIGAIPDAARKRPNMEKRKSSSGQQGKQHAKEAKQSNPIRMVIAVVDGKQEPRQVEIGMSNFEQAEVISGLAEGETVLTSVNSKALKDREAFLDRMKSWNQIPGMGKSK
ncbi:MAG: efflux RND transporter periplasmic adaptor subunit [candidate division Zixibacteria bacterium]|nr:efflux RND transporter periplasmic adaptor subunit [candidate division Zixibacteria bacterium]